MKSFALAALLARVGQVVATRARCLVDDEQGIAQPFSFSRIAADRQQQASAVPSEIAVDVHFHITSITDYADLVTDDIIAAQWDILSKTYADYNITLSLASTERIVDDLAGAGWLVYNGTDWNNYPEEQKAFFNATRKGGYDALNLYFFAPWSPGASGYCTFPTTVGGALPQEGDEAFYTDLCEISALSMPGIPADNATLDGYYYGHVAIHETGHWFGLNHTFAGGCNEPGDFVADTPATALVYDCPVSSDTCPDVPGLDPIHNFMSYTNDSCTYEFTPGQKDRMFDTFFGYRRISE
ncbi:metalloprotease [Pestalotiopsis sp. NC0098]|nr:metalloprotease [Pestalotiopsis sp. NC0098]